MTRGGHGLPNVLIVSAMAVPRVAARRAGSLWLSSTPLDTPRRTPMKQRKILQSLSVLGRFRVTLNPECTVTQNGEKMG